MKKLNNAEKLELIYKDLSAWMDGNDQDGSLEFAFNNGYYLHPISLWISSGATSEGLDLDVTIDPKKEREEIDSICREAAIYECEHCNHHAFIEDDTEKSIQCMSCNKEAVLSSKIGEV